MSEHPKPTEPDHVACDVCMTEIPRSVATNFEADDYTLHFCGLTCYEKWQKTRSSGDSSAAKD